MYKGVRQISILNYQILFLSSDLTDFQVRIVGLIRVIRQI